MPFRRLWLWVACMALAVALAAAEGRALILAGGLLAGVSTGMLYRPPKPDPTTWAWAHREAPVFRRPWAWFVSRPAWMQRVLAGLSPAAAVVILAAAG